MKRCLILVPLLICISCAGGNGSNPISPGIASSITGLPQPPAYGFVYTTNLTNDGAAVQGDLWRIRTSAPEIEVDGKTFYTRQAVTVTGTLIFEVRPSPTQPFQTVLERPVTVEKGPTFFLDLLVRRNGLPIDAMQVPVRLTSGLVLNEDAGTSPDGQIMYEVPTLGASLPLTLAVGESVTVAGTRYERARAQDPAEILAPLPTGAADGIVSVFVDFE